MTSKNQQKDIFCFSSISICLVLMTIFVVINARSSSSSNNLRLCPEEYRELRRRDDDSSSDSEDDQWREDICEQSIDLAARQRIPIKNRSILRHYCVHYEEALELARENNDTTCEKKKREIGIQRKRDDDEDSSDSDDDNDEKRRALRKRELHKRFALRFIRKRMS